MLTRTEGATTYTHGYDVPGRQASVAVTGGATSSFVYNGGGALVARQVAGRTVARYATGGLYEQDPTTGTIREYATFGGRRVAVTTTTTTPAPPVTTVQYLHQDHLGSTGLVTTASGAFAQARFHAPFGAPWYAPTTTAAAPALGTRFGEPWPAAGTRQPAPPATDRHYTGQRSFEASLGSLYHYQARWYSPVLGRFLSPDPIVPEPGNPQAFNRYSYVYNNPFGFIDPSGHCALNSEDPDEATAITQFDCSIEDFNELSLRKRKRWLELFAQLFDQGRWFNDIIAIIQMSHEQWSLARDEGFRLADAVVLAAINDGMNRLEGKAVNSTYYQGQAVEGMDDAITAWMDFFINKDGPTTKALRSRSIAEQKGVDAAVVLTKRPDTPQLDPAHAFVIDTLGRVYRDGVQSPGLVASAFAGLGALGGVAAGPAGIVVGVVAGAAGAVSFFDPRNAMAPQFGGLLISVIDFIR